MLLIVPSEIEEKGSAMHLPWMPMMIHQKSFPGQNITCDFSLLSLATVWKIVVNHDLLMSYVHNVIMGMMKFLF
jgi:hypothetical protein